MLVCVTAVVMATSFDKYDYGYGIYDDGYDNSAGNEANSHQKAAQPVLVGLDVKRIAAPLDAPAYHNRVHFYYLYYPIYRVYYV